MRLSPRLNQHASGVVLGVTQIINGLYNPVSSIIITTTIFFIIIIARYVTRLRMLHSRSWAAEMYGCLRNTQVLNMATSASKRKSVL